MLRREDTFESSGGEKYVFVFARTKIVWRFVCVCVCVCTDSVCMCAESVV